MGKSLLSLVELSLHQKDEALSDLASGVVHDGAHLVEMLHARALVLLSR
jgi:hypothetical protein